MCTYSPSLLNLPPTYPHPTLLVIIEHQAEFPMLYRSFPLAIYFTHGSIYIREGIGNPLQCSCLKNPRDRGAWWAAIYGVTQSRTRLKRLSSSSSNSVYLSVRLSQFIPPSPSPLPCPPPRTAEAKRKECSQ